MSNEHDVALPELPEPLVMVNRYGISASTSDGDGGVFTADQMRSYARAAIAQHRAKEWMPIETAPKDGLVDILMPGPRRYAGCHWDAICSEFRHISACGVLIRLRGATHWCAIPPLPAAPHIKYTTA
jgi:hypothetical protein